jgi:hypothetical protein
MVGGRKVTEAVHRGTGPSLAVAIVVDGCNESYISPRTMPFVHRLRQAGSYASMLSLPTFDHRRVLFTGQSPRTAESFVAFCLAPNESPLRHLRWVRPPMSWHTGAPRVDGILSALERMRTGVQPDNDDVSLLTAAHYAATKTWVDFGHIPLAFLPHLAIDESIYRHQREERTRSRRHLFGVLAQHGFDLRFIYGGAETVTHRAMLAHKHTERPSVWFLHYGSVDKLGHRYGPESEPVRSALNTIDESIKRIYTALESEIDFLLLLSDHGMLAINQCVDLQEALSGIQSRPIDDYLVFLNSPLARFSFNTPRAEAEIRSLLGGLHKYGREIAPEELAARGLPNCSRYGDLIFWCRPGFGIWPNFYHRVPVKGMHSYFDHYDRVPLILFHRDPGVRLKGQAELQDVTPTISDLLGLPIPQVDGRSVVEHG